MAINFINYVDITSGVGASPQVPERQLIGRLFTDNNLLPTKSIIEFDTAADVGSYFGTSSAEYLRASVYFGWVSKNITSPKTISFARWADSAVAPMIFGKPVASTALAALQAIASGGIALTMDGVTNQISGIDFTAITSFADAAALLQTKIRTETGTQWTAATVVFSASSSFNLVGGDPQDANIVVAPPVSGTDISSLIGWAATAGVYPNAPIFSNGSAIETITQVLTNSTAVSNNFGSFLFMPTFNTSQITEAATWNSQQNVDFQYMVRVTAGNASAVSAAILSLGGNAMTLAPIATEYPEQAPMMVLAATDYDAVNSVQNYMFQQFPSFTPSVTTDADKSAYDALRVNYYGQTQTAGQLISFYQNGQLTGVLGSTYPIAMNVYANEQWLKDAFGSALMGLLLAVSRISANTQGIAQILAVMQPVISQAVNNGTISVGTTLSATQKQYISQVTGDANAWHQVQSIGYWVNAVITSSTVNNVIVYVANYTFVYKKDDVISKIVGRDILI